MKNAGVVFKNIIKGGMLMAMLVTSAAYAQRGQMARSAEDRAEMQTTMMQRQLELKPEQVAQVKAINLKYAKQIEDMRQSGAGPEAEKQARMEEMTKMAPARDAELKKVLTAEQYKKHKELDEQRRAEMRNGRGMQPPPAGR